MLSLSESTGRNGMTHSHAGMRGMYFNSLCHSFRVLVEILARNIIHNV